MHKLDRSWSLKEGNHMEWCVWLCDFLLTAHTQLRERKQLRLKQKAKNYWHEKSEYKIWGCQIAGKWRKETERRMCWWTAPNLNTKSAQTLSWFLIYKCKGETPGESMENKVKRGDFSWCPSERKQGLEFESSQVSWLLE